MNIKKIPLDFVVETTTGQKKIVAVEEGIGAPLSYSNSQAITFNGSGYEIVFMQFDGLGGDVNQNEINAKVVAKVFMTPEVMKNFKDYVSAAVSQTESTQSLWSQSNE